MESQEVPRPPREAVGSSEHGARSPTSPTSDLVSASRGAGSSAPFLTFRGPGAGSVRSSHRASHRRLLGGLQRERAPPWLPSSWSPGAGRVAVESNPGFAPLAVWFQAGASGLLGFLLPACKLETAPSQREREQEGSRSPRPGAQEASPGLSFSLCPPSLLTPSPRMNSGQDHLRTHILCLPARAPSPHTPSV